ELRLLLRGLIAADLPRRFVGKPAIESRVEILHRLRLGHGEAEGGGLGLVGGKNAVRLGEKRGRSRENLVERSIDLRRHEKRGGIRASGQVGADCAGHRAGGKYSAVRVLNSVSMPAAAETSTCPRCSGSGWIPVPG